jgi:hypothetical protein
MEFDDSKISYSDLPAQAYSALNNFFSAHESEVVEIEILPPAIQPTDGLLMQDGLNLGVPKKVLVAAYVKARQLFFEGIKVETTSIVSVIISDYCLRLTDAGQQAFEASRIVLLFDPEHITVANYRKRRILKLKEEDEGGLTIENSVGKEMIFLNSILTSPLHRQSKSPTLWHHRAWLLELLIPITLVNSCKGDLMSFLSAELHAVLKAGERHPKNYYAFQYARRLFSRIESPEKDETSLLWEASYPVFLSAHARLVKMWCCRHPSDISGWSFLLFLLPRLETVSGRYQIVQQVLEYAINLKAQQVSVWVFLRTALAESFLEERRDGLVQQLYEFQQAREIPAGDDSAENLVTQLDKWIKSYSKVLPDHPRSGAPNAG